MRKILPSLIASAVFLSVLLFTGCVETDYLSEDDDTEIVSLTSGWTYSLENPLEVEDVSFTKLSYDDLRNLENVIPGKSGYIYLLKTFRIPQSLKGQSLGCYLGRITMADQTWFNGSFIGETGRMPPNYFSYWNSVRFYTIPEDIISNDWNEILVKVWVDGEGSIVSNPFIGTIKDTRRAAEIEEFWNSKIQLCFTFVMLVIAIYNILLFFKQSKKKGYLLYALINIISAVYLSVFYLPEIPWLPGDRIQFLWYQKIVDNALTYLMPFMVTSYLNTFFNRKDSSVALALRIGFVVFPIILVLMIPSYMVLHSLRSWLQVLLVPPLIYALYIIVEAIVQKKEGTTPLLLGISPLVFSVVLDLVLHNVMKLYDLPYFAPIGWQLVIIAMLFIMTNLLSSSINEVENLNKTLEKKVEDRTKELSESYEKLSSANADLNYANSKLEESRTRSEQDMKLAVYVQQSFYPRKAPLVDGWDIAYYFKPASGVSGDLYDFFTEGDKLLGLGLFDISGHGISSGLVGMIAKGVIERIFAAEKNEPFSKVMKDINEDFISEKGDVENYFTGVLLRVNDNKVEFVNAGHPPVLYRTASGQNVVPVQVRGSENSMTDTGSIVGIKDLPVNYKPIGFNMNKGDSIILYTDCFNESRSKDGQIFGTDGIKEAFASSGNGSAKDKLDYVIGRFNEFTEDTILADDLTVIVLERTK